MTIIKSTEAIQVEHPIYMIYGPPGIGKSSLGYSAKDPLLLDFDAGAHRAVNRRDTLVINSWKDAVELTSNTELLEPYSTIVPDTVGRTIDAIIADLAQKDPKKCPGGNPSQQGWGVVKNTFRLWLNSIRGLGKDVLLISHEKEDRDGDSRIMRADIAGGSYSEVFKSADFVGYLYLSGKQRILDFSPTDRWIGKNPGQWNPIEIPAISKATDFMAHWMSEGKKVLGAVSEESAKIAAEVEDWRIAISVLDCADDLNNTLPKVLKIKSAIVQPQIKRLLMNRSKALSIPFDTAKKKFVAPVVEEPEIDLGPEEEVISEN